MTTNDRIRLVQPLFDCATQLRRIIDGQLKPFKVSFARARILESLVEGEITRQSELARKLGVAPRTVTALVNALERDGLVRRARDPAHRRAYRLQITDRGRHIHAEVEAQLRNCDDLFSEMGAVEVSALAELLGRLADTLTESADRPHPLGSRVVSRS